MARKKARKLIIHIALFKTIDITIATKILGKLNNDITTHLSNIVHRYK